MVWCWFFLFRMWADHSTDVMDFKVAEPVNKNDVIA